jgi:hypothetical protein
VPGELLSSTAKCPLSISEETFISLSKVAFLMQRILRCGVVAHRAIASVEKSTGERFQAPLRSRLTLKTEGGRATTEVLSPQRLVQDGGFSNEPYSGAC